MDPIDNVLARLNHSKAGPQQWNATCPCRADDENPSLRVSVGKQGQVLMKCLRGGGCDLNEICESIDVTPQELWPKTKQSPTKPKKKATLQESYPYYDATDNLVMEVLRYVDSDGKKTFKQRAPDGQGGWVWTTSGIEKPLYRLPEVLEAKMNGHTIYVVEGEKDVHALESIGYIATTNPGGAGGEGQNKWTSNHTEALAGAKVAIICDNDEPGYIHARAVNSELLAAGCKVKVFKPGKFKDVADLIASGADLANELIPFDETPEQESDVDHSALDTLIESLQNLQGTDLSEGVLAGRVASSVDTFLSTRDREHRDTGNLVEWSPFLETDFDLSYDWVIPNLLERQERVIVVASEGAGKRATISSMIPTPYGWTKLGDIKVGDKVIDRFGNPVNVTYVSPVEPNPDSYRVHFSDGSYVDADAEHNWYTETIKEREKRRVGKVRTTAEIRDSLISNRVSKALNHAVPTTEPLQLPEADLLVDPYTLGVWLGDGNSANGGISNADSDKQIIDRVSGSYDVRLRESSVRNGKVPMWGVLGLQTQLRELGILGNKRIPMQYLRSSYSQRLALLQGLMDTDGTIDTGGSSEFCVCNKALANDVHELLMTFGIKATLNERDSVLNGKAVGKRYRIYFTTDLPVFSLQRKSDRIKPLRTPRSKYRYITAVEKIEPEPMLCISVDGPDNTYLIGESFIPTHNTTLARQVALMSAAGIHPFRRDRMPKARTLMIDLENPERIIRRTSMRIYDSIKAYKMHEGMDAHLLMKPDGVNLLTPQDRAIVEEHVAAIEPDILFFGPLYKSFIDPGGRTAESVSIEIARFLDYIRHTYNCALWIEHHAPLGSGGQRDLRPFGSAVWSRWSEFGIALSPDPTDPELIDFKHYRGQREAREWPTLCKRGSTWPFEVIEFSQYDSGQPQTRTDEELNEALANEEFDDQVMDW